MNQLPINPASREEQQRILEQMYVLMGKQVQSYYKHRHMGSNSSVPAELAQELMESIEYTIQLAGGIYTHKNMEEALRLGQGILESRVGDAKSLLELVCATAPRWQTECRWEALRYLRHYLNRYDRLHLAHEGPGELFYPILISPPEDLRGIDSCIFYLKVMWIENQIMAGFPEDVLEEFWERLPAAALNQCEYVLINGIGKAVLGAGIDPLVFEPEEQMQLTAGLMGATEEKLKDAAALLCRWLALKSEDAKLYVEAILPQVMLWTGENVPDFDLGNLFL